MGVSIEEYRQRIGCFVRVATRLSSCRVRSNNSDSCRKQSKHSRSALPVFITRWVVIKIYYTSDRPALHISYFLFSPFCLKIRRELKIVIKTQTVKQTQCDAQAVYKKVGVLPIQKVKSKVLQALSLTKGLRSKCQTSYSVHIGSHTAYAARTFIALFTLITFSDFILGILQ